jgi:hypothetical protein
MLSVSKFGKALVMGVVASVLVGACSDAPTEVTPQATMRANALQKNMLACDPTAFQCGGSGGDGIPAPDPRIYFHAFLVYNCDPSIDVECSGYCDPYDTSCHQQRIDGSYYEIRQNLREANGDWIAYNEQRWHGDAGVVDIPIFDTRMCSGSGRYMNVEIYHLSDNYGIVDRVVSFDVHEGDRNTMKVVGNGITWTAHIQYNWEAC